MQTPPEDEKNGVVYAIRHVASGRCYVGSTVRLKRRWWTHRNALESKTHHSVFLQRAWDKYGGDSFVFEILEIVADGGRLLECEQKWIDSENSAFNMAKCATAFRRGYKMSESERARHSERMRKAGPKIAATLRGRPGRKLTEDAKSRISRSLMGHPVTPEQIEKQKRSFAASGYRHSDEVKTKIGAASRVRKRTKITRDRQSASIKAWWARRKAEQKTANEDT